MILGIGCMLLTIINFFTQQSIAACDYLIMLFKRGLQRFNAAEIMVMSKLMFEMYLLDQKNEKLIYKSTVYVNKLPRTRGYPADSCYKVTKHI